METRLIPGRGNMSRSDADHYPLIFHRDTARSHLLLTYADFMPFDIWLLKASCSIFAPTSKPVCAAMCSHSSCDGVNASLLADTSRGRSHLLHKFKVEAGFY